MNIDRHVEQIKARLVKARERAGLTQAQAAKLLGFNAGSNIAQYEGERSIPNLRLFLQMCEVYKVSPVWALTGINPDFNPMPIIEAFDDLTDDAIKVIDLLGSLQQLESEST
jgi:transcriptional regulator with XRE-family HTH domain